MGYLDQQFFGVIEAQNILQENIVVITGDLTQNSDIINNISTVGYDLSLLQTSQSVFSVAGAFTPSAYVTNIDFNLNTLTLSETSSLTQNGDTLGFSTPPGVYLFESCSFQDPQGILTVENISGSNEGEDYAVLAAAKRGNATLVGKFHSYIISNVIYRNISTSEISFFVEWGEPGIESDSGDTIQTIEKTLSIVNLTNSGSLAPGFSLGTNGLESLPIGSEFAGWNLAINNYLSGLSNTNLDITNNVDNYLITATGTNTLNGESGLRFSGSCLIIGNTGSSAEALLTITGSGDLLLIRPNTGSGIRVNNEGTFQLITFEGIPTPVGGGIYYSGSEFFVGID